MSPDDWGKLSPITSPATPNTDLAYSLAQSGDVGATLAAADDFRLLNSAVSLRSGTAGSAGGSASGITATPLLGDAMTEASSSILITSPRRRLLSSSVRASDARAAVDGTPVENEIISSTIGDGSHIDGEDDSDGLEPTVRQHSAAAQGESDSKDDDPAASTKAFETSFDTLVSTSLALQRNETADTLNAENVSLRTSMMKLRDENIAIRAALSTAKNDIHTARGEYEALEAQHRRLTEHTAAAVEEVAAQASALEQQRDVLATQLREAQKERIPKLQAEVAALAAELSDANLRIGAAQADRDAARSEAEHYKQGSVDLTAQLDAARQASVERGSPDRRASLHVAPPFRRTVSGAQEAHDGDAPVDAMLRPPSEQDDAFLRAMDLEREVARLKIVLETAQTERERLDAALQAAERRVADSTRGFDEVDAVLRKERDAAAGLRRELAEQTAERDGLNRRVVQLTTELADSNTRCATAVGERDVLDAELTRLRREAERVEVLLGTAEAAARDGERARDGLTKDLSVVATERDGLRARLDAQSHELAVLQKEATRSGSAAAAADTALAELREENARLARRAAAGATAEQSSSVQRSAVARLESQAQQHEALLGVRRDEIARCEALIAEQRDIIAGLRAEAYARGLDTARERTQAGLVEERCADAERELADLKVSYDVRCNEVDIASQALAAARARAAEAEDTVAELRTEMAKLSTLLATQAVEHGAQQAHLEAEQQSAAGMQHEMETLRGTVRSLEAALDRAKDDAAAAGAELHDENAALQEAAAQATAELDAYKQEMQSSFRKACTERDALMLEQAGWVRDRASLNAAVGELDAMVEQLREQKDLARRRLGATEFELQTTRGEVTSLQNRLRAALHDRANGTTGRRSTRGASPLAASMAAPAARSGEGADTTLSPTRLDDGRLDASLSQSVDATDAGGVRGSPSRHTRDDGDDAALAAAATRLQAVARGGRARVSVAYIRHDAAALRIQALTRGRRARKETDEARVRLLIARTERLVDDYKVAQDELTAAKDEAATAGRALATARAELDVASGRERALRQRIDHVIAQRDRLDYLIDDAIRQARAIPTAGASRGGAYERSGAALADGIACYEAIVAMLVETRARFERDVEPEAAATITTRAAPATASPAAPSSESTPPTAEASAALARELLRSPKRSPTAALDRRVTTDANTDTMTYSNNAPLKTHLHPTLSRGRGSGSTPSPHRPPPPAMDGGSYVSLGGDVEDDAAGAPRAGETPSDTSGGGTKQWFEDSASIEKGAKDHPVAADKVALDSEVRRLEASVAQSIRDYRAGGSRGAAGAAAAGAADDRALYTTLVSTFADGTRAEPPTRPARAASTSAATAVTATGLSASASYGRAHSPRDMFAITTTASVVGGGGGGAVLPFSSNATHRSTSLPQAAPGGANAVSSALAALRAGVGLEDVSGAVPASLDPINYAGAPSGGTNVGAAAATALRGGAAMPLAIHPLPEHAYVHAAPEPHDTNPESVLRDLHSRGAGYALPRVAYAQVPAPAAPFAGVEVDAAHPPLPAASAGVGTGGRGPGLGPGAHRHTLHPTGSQGTVAFGLGGDAHVLPPAGDGAPPPLGYQPAARAPQHHPAHAPAGQAGGGLAVPVGPHRLPGAAAEDRHHAPVSPTGAAGGVPMPAWAGRYCQQAPPASPVAAGGIATPLRGQGQYTRGSAFTSTAAGMPSPRAYGSAAREPPGGPGGAGKRGPLVHAAGARSGLALRSSYDMPRGGRVDPHREFAGVPPSCLSDAATPITVTQPRHTPRPSTQPGGNGLARHPSQLPAAVLVHVPRY